MKTYPKTSCHNKIVYDENKKLFPIIIINIHFVIKYELKYISSCDIFRLLQGLNENEKIVTDLLDMNEKQKN